MAGNFAYGDSVSISSIFTRALSVLSLHPRAMLGSALLITLLPIIVIVLLAVALGAGFLANAGGGIPPLLAFFFIFAGVGAAMLIGSLAAQAAMARALIAHEQGDAVTFRGCLAAGLGKFIPLFSLSLVMTIGLTTGFILLVFPAIMLAVTWSVAAPAMATENLGVIAALSRSADLTRGYRWQIFGLCCLTYAFYWMVSRVVEFLDKAVNFTGNWSGSMGTIGAIVGGFIPLLFWTMCIALWGALAASLYLELRIAREGPLTDGLAEVFA